jgi:putative sterol carrier protein
MAGKCARAISLLSDYMNRTAEVKKFISGWESKVLFDLSGEEPFWLDFSKDGKVTFNNGKIFDPDVTFYCNSDLFFEMLTGKIDQDEAFSNGLVEIKGSIFDSVKFRHAAELTQEKHNMIFTMLRTFSRLT